jgi:hypothetical protein
MGLKSIVALGVLLWSGELFADPFLLPSQEEPNFYNAKMCENREVLAAIKTAASMIFNQYVILAHGKGQNWAGYQPDDVHLEAVSTLPEGKAIFCSMTITARQITERLLYSVGQKTSGSNKNSLIIKFGGDLGPLGGGRKLFPETIEIEPSSVPAVERYGSTSALADNATIRPQLEKCTGILHRDRDGIHFGGARGEGICVISKSEERKVLARCSVGHLCIVNGLIDLCKESGECVEVLSVTSARKN